MISKEYRSSESTGTGLINFVLPVSFFSYIYEWSRSLFLEADDVVEASLDGVDDTDPLPLDDTDERDVLLVLVKEVDECDRILVANAAAAAAAASSLFFVASFIAKFAAAFASCTVGY